MSARHLPACDPPAPLAEKDAPDRAEESAAPDDEDGYRFTGSREPIRLVLSGRVPGKSSCFREERRQPARAIGKDVAPATRAFGKGVRRSARAFGKIVSSAEGTTFESPPLGVSGRTSRQPQLSSARRGLDETPGKKERRRRIIACSATGSSFCPAEHCRGNAASDAVRAIRIGLGVPAKRFAFELVVIRCGRRSLERHIMSMVLVQYPLVPGDSCIFEAPGISLYAASTIASILNGCDSGPRSSAFSSSYSRGRPAGRFVLCGTPRHPDEGQEAVCVKSRTSFRRWRGKNGLRAEKYRASQHRLLSARDDKSPDPVAG